jgi:hypothetical protein
MYKVIFQDRSTFIGGSPKDSKWLLIPDKSIQKISYLFGDKLLVLENYEAYNHLVDKKCYLNNSGNMIYRVRLLGKKGNDVIIYNFDIEGRRFYADIKPFSNKYTGWKKGIIGLKPTSKIKNLGGL